MKSITDNMTAETNTWQLNALTEALGDLTLTVSDSLSVGRGSDSDVVLGSKQVSRDHAVLSVLDGQLYVKDLDSSNGTFINDRRITGNESNVLQADDTLGFASFVFQVQATATPKEDTTLAPVISEESVSSTDDEIAQPVATENVHQESIPENQMDSEPVVKQTGIEEILPNSNTEEVSPVDTDLTTAPDTTTDKTADMVIAPTTEEVVAESVSKEPVVKETGIEDVLSAVDSAAPTPVEEKSVEVGTTSESTVPTTTEPVVSETVMAEPETVTTPEQPTATATATNESASLVEQEPVVEQPVAHKEPTVREEPADQVEHDKTTKTELQEEADPDVLRAKQAASAQFSGTANLGQDRDLGTEGNNAMDQEVSNPAHTGQVEKKASGGWFIWVFLAILIIGLALWLFNMGGV